jgi:hypothetical protein
MLRRPNKAPQCRAMNRVNIRCKHRTTRGEYCHQHQEQNGFRIVPSTLEDKGLGLKVAKPVEKGEAIAPFTGTVLSTTLSKTGPFLARAETDPVKNYHRYVDAKSPFSGAARYAQHSKSKSNAELIYNHKNKKLYLQALDDLKAGEEVFVNWAKNFEKTAPTKRLRIAKEINMDQSAERREQQIVDAARVPGTRTDFAEEARIRSQAAAALRQDSDDSDDDSAAPAPAPPQLSRIPRIATARPGPVVRSLGPVVRVLTKQEKIDDYKKRIQKFKDVFDRAEQQFRLDYTALTADPNHDRDKATEMRQKLVKEKANIDKLIVSLRKRLAEARAS